MTVVDRLSSLQVSDKIMVMDSHNEVLGNSRIRGSIKNLLTVNVTILFIYIFYTWSKIYFLFDRIFFKINYKFQMFDWIDKSYIFIYCIVKPAVFDTCMLTLTCILCK